MKRFLTGCLTFRLDVTGNSSRNRTDSQLSCLQPRRKVFTVRYELWFKVIQVNVCLKGARIPDVGRPAVYRS
jgi:hypothetical protein